MLRRFEGTAMRPISIQWFDRLFLSGLALELALRIIHAREALYVANTENAPLFIGMGATYFFVMSALWLAISRYSSNIGKWALTTLLVVTPVAFAITSVHPAALFYHLNLGSAAFIIVRPLLYITATIMLLRPDARAWLSKHEDTFEAGTVG